MKVMIVPLIVMSAVAGELSKEPNEAQMRGAFEQALAMQVRNALDFAAESGGPQAVDEIKKNGTHRFEVRTFDKRACTRTIGQHSFRCDFAVDIDVVNGSLQGALTGRFFIGSQGLMFAQEEPGVAQTAMTGVP